MSDTAPVASVTVRPRSLLVFADDAYELLWHGILLDSTATSGLYRCVWVRVCVRTIHVRLVLCSWLVASIP